MLWTHLNPQLAGVNFRFEATEINGVCKLNAIPFNLFNRRVGQVYHLPTFQGRMQAFRELLQHRRQVKDQPHPRN